MVKTRHAGIVALGITTAAQALAGACGDTQFVDALSTGNILIATLTFADFIIARVKNAKGNANA